MRKLIRYFTLTLLILCLLLSLLTVHVEANSVQSISLKDLVIYVDNVHSRGFSIRCFLPLGINKISFMSTFSKINKDVYYLADIVVLYNVYREFKAEELQDLYEWIRKGGRLIIISNTYSKPLEKLLSLFNVSISPNLYSGTFELKGFLKTLGKVAGSGFLLKGLTPLAECSKGSLAVYGSIGEGKVVIATSSMFFSEKYLAKILSWLAEGITRGEGKGEVVFKLKKIGVPFNQILFEVVYSGHKKKYMWASNYLKVSTEGIEKINIPNFLFSTSIVGFLGGTIYLKPVDREIEVEVKVYGFPRIIITTYENKPVFLGGTIFPRIISANNMYYLVTLTTVDNSYKKIWFSLKVEEKIYNFSLSLHTNTTFISIGSFKGKKIRVKVIDEKGKPVKNAVVYCFTEIPRLWYLYSENFLLRPFDVSDSNGLAEVPYSTKGVYIVAFKDYENTPCIDYVGVKYIDIPRTDITYTIELKKTGVLFLTNIEYSKHYLFAVIKTLSGKSPWTVHNYEAIFTSNQRDLAYFLLPVGGRYKITLIKGRRYSLTLTNESKGYSVYRGFITLVDYRIAELEQKKKDVFKAINKIENLRKELYYGKIEGINLIDAEILLNKSETHLRCALYYIDKGLADEYLKEYEVGLSYLKDAEYQIMIYIRPLFVFSIVLLIIMVLSGLACASMISGERSTAVKTLLTIAVVVIYVYVLSMYHPGFKLLFSSSAPYFREKIILLSLIVASVCYLVYWDMPRYLAREYVPEKPSRLSIATSAFSIGLRNLRRRKMRTTLYLLTVFFMIFSLVAFTSVQPHVTLTKSIIFYETNALSSGIVYQVRYLSEGEKADVLSIVKHVVGNKSKIVLRIMSLKEGFEGLAMSHFMKTGEEEYYFTTIKKGNIAVKVRGILGIEPSKEIGLTLLPSIVVKGRFLLDNDTRGVLISMKYAKLLGVDVGDTIKVLSYELKIVGIFDEEIYSKVKDLDGALLRPWNVFVKSELPTYSRATSPEGVLIVHIDFAKLLKDYCYLDKIIVKTSSPEEAEKLAAQLVRAVSIISPYLCENGKAYIVSRATLLQVRGLDTLVVIIIGSLISANLMIAEVHERRREISTYTAVGMTPSHVKNFFLAQAFLLTFTGGGLGYLTAVVFINYIKSLPSFAELNISITPMWAILAFIVVVLVNLIASSLPARKASLQVVPSYKRKWELKLGRKGVYEETLPFRVHENKIDTFIKAVDKKIHYYYPDQGLERTEWCREHKRVLSDGTEVREIEYLIWSAMGGTTSQSVLVKLTFAKASGEKYYSLKIKVEPKVKGYKYRDFVYRIVDRIRKICLETNVSLRRST